MSILRRVVLLAIVICTAVIVAYVYSTLNPIVASVSQTALLQIGDEEKIGISGLDVEYPDCQVSFINSQVFLSKGNKSVLVNRSEQSVFSFVRILALPTQQSVHGLQSWYLGFCSVFEVSNGEVWALYQEEFRPNESASGAFAAQIGYAVSTDGGNSFVLRGPILSSDNMWNRDGRTISGIGQPNGIIHDGYLYLYFTNWDSGHDSIHLVRIQLSSESLSAEAWNGDSFIALSDPRILPKGVTRPVVINRDTPVSEGYTALASVSYNNALETYIMGYETACGFRYQQSADLLHWTNEQELINFNPCKGGEPIGLEWRGYPSLVSFDEPNSSKTNRSVQLVYACKLIGEITHTMCIRTITFAQ